jgi:diguanylate cyclase (GGDEF)-like protein
VIGDLDGLKTLNDRHGHQHGDEVLCEIARVATAAARRIDAVARLGGDEFALVLPRCGARDAHAVAERLRGRTRTALAGLGEGGSISFGVASYPEHAGTVDDLVLHADHALYRAKRAGRDCTVLYGADVAAAHAAERCPHDAQLPAVLALAETLDLRSAGRAAHSRVVADHAQAIAEQLGLEPERVERVRLAALLRDIGKVGLPDALLNALGAGDPVEAAELRRHPELGSRILAGAGLDDLATWILAHHERVDGLGYPAGLAGDEIPLESRILAVASAFAAQTTDRPGWPAASPEQAAERLRDEAGTRFDPEVVEAFLESRRRAAAEAAG